MHNSTGARGDGMLARAFVRFSSVATAVALLGLSSPTSAVMVQTINNAAVTNVVFLDDFENAPVIDGEPIAPEVGSWAFTSFYSHVFTNVPPGAAQGTKYLRMNRPPGGGTTIVADYGAVSSASFSNVVASFSFYVPASTSAAVFEVSLTPNFDTGVADYFNTPVWLEGIDNPGSPSTVGDLYTYLGPGGYPGAFTNTGMSFRKGVWNIMTINYSFLTGANNDFFTFSVNGATSAAINAGGAGNVADPANLRYLDFRTGDFGMFFLDAIPEPSAIGLVAVGLFALFARSNRRR